MRKIMSTVLLALAAGITVTACSAGQETASSTTTPTTTRTTEPTARGAPTQSTFAPAPASDTPAKATTECGITRGWNTEEETAAPYTSDALYLVRVGQHDCYDRVVLDINGPAEVGYVVRYMPVVTADGSGEPVPVAGGAALMVVTHAPPLGLDSGGHQPGTMFAATGDHLHTADQLKDWRSLRAVRYAGFFEGQSTMAIGVRTELPFRVFTRLDPTSQLQHIVIDIAHDR
jgi:hypothetical protein